jgi:hypothetical protein
MNIKKASALMILAVIGLTFMSVAPAQAGNPDGDKVQFCHSDEGKKGYTYNDTSIDSVVDIKTGEHKGHGLDANDIVPKFNWVYGGVRLYFDGLNLDKSSYINVDAKTCIAPATPGAVTPAPPIYIPATCLDPKAMEHPYGIVNVPTDLGDGVKSATEPVLNAAKTSWNVTYTLNDNNAEFTYAWPANQTGVYDFTVVPLTADKNWVVDSKTGKAGCELPDTGAKRDLMVYSGIGLGILGLGGIVMLANTALKRRS